jgi:hypothetical protein
MLTCAADTPDYDAAPGVSAALLPAARAPQCAEVVFEG